MVFIWKQKFSSEISTGHSSSIVRKNLDNWKISMFNIDEIKDKVNTSYIIDIKTKFQAYDFISVKT